MVKHFQIINIENFDDQDYNSPEKRPIESENHISVISKQNEIIKRLATENTVLKETVKREQQEKYTLMLEFEKYKKKIRNQNKLVDIATMSNYVNTDQVRNNAIYVQHF
jgi:predicted RNase H-like nuclease (RuvC/YqgF family)